MALLIFQILYRFLRFKSFEIRLKLRVYDNDGWPFEAFDMAFNTAASLLQRLAAQKDISHMISFYLNGVLHGGKRLNFG